MDEKVGRVIDAHRAAGTFFQAAGVGSFARAEGEGETIVLVHGLPASSFLYRKVIPGLAARGFHAVSFDLPGLGLAERPRQFDYSIAGLGAFASAAVDALGIDRFHLVVHDAGGPVGFELVGHDPSRIRSMTITNTLVQLDAKPFPGEIMARFTQNVPTWAAAPWLWRTMMYRVGILDRASVPVEEVDAYRELALGDDAGAAYLEIMRRVRPADGKPRSYSAVVDARRVPYPVQLIWGVNDPLLSLRRFGWKALRATGLSRLSALPARHFLHEDQAPAIAELVAQHAATAR